MEFPLHVVALVSFGQSGSQLHRPAQPNLRFTVGATREGVVARNGIVVRRPLDVMSALEMHRQLGGDLLGAGAIGAFQPAMSCLDVEGRLVRCDEDDALRSKVNELLSGRSVSLVLNLKEVSQIDTSGLSALIAIKLAVDRSGGQIRLMNVPARVLSVLVITKIITLFDVIESEKEMVSCSGAEVRT